MDAAKPSCCAALKTPLPAQNGAQRTEPEQPPEGCGKPPVEPKKCCPDPGEKASGCGPSPAPDKSCCPAQPDQPEIAGYSIFPFVSGWLDTSIGRVPQVSCKLSWVDRSGRWAMRWGIGREHYRVTPGLYAVGRPDQHSPLLISANYKLSFDCLRVALDGENAWILVLDTKGVNVWCAAGKGTFSTEEIVKRCINTRLPELLSHRTMIVPQLGAPGVAAYKVKQECGFQVIYGPIRAKDLKEFLAAGMQATTKMRQVSFTLWERLILTPVEITGMGKTILIAILVLFVLSGIGSDLFSFAAAWRRGLAAVGVGLVGVVTGCILTPLLLPWIPTRAFAAKGALLGLISATVLALGPYREAGPGGWICLYLAVIAVSSYTAMNFTGSTTFTSPSGVEKEMRYAIPGQALAILVAGLIWIGAAF
jgi:hypothetical protein